MCSTSEALYQYELLCKAIKPWWYAGLLPPFPFPMLANTFGPGAFDVGGTRFQLFLSIRSATACEFMDTWPRNRLSINGENSTGPFDVDADQAGHDSTHRMQQTPHD